MSERLAWVSKCIMERRELDSPGVIARRQLLDVRQGPDLQEMLLGKTRISSKRSQRKDQLTQGLVGCRLNSLSGGRRLGHGTSEHEIELTCARLQCQPRSSEYRQL